MYKIKLASGRVLGPIDIERIKLLILKNQIIGKEMGRSYPEGEWVDINQISEIADLLLAHISGDLKGFEGGGNPNNYQPILGQPNVQGTEVLGGATAVLENENAEKADGLTEKPMDDSSDRTMIGGMDDSNEKTQIGNPLNFDGPLDKLEVVEFSHGTPAPDEQKRVEIEGGALEFENQAKSSIVSSRATISSSPRFEPKNIAGERTVAFQKPSLNEGAHEKSSRKRPSLMSILIVLLALGGIGTAIFDEGPEKKVQKRFEPVRLQLPSAVKGPPDPSKSNQLYGLAMKEYVADTALGYRNAARELSQAVSYDVSNVKALAMLASSYINLIDSSNKDENYFSILSKLIDMSRAKSVDLAETVIADVELYLVVNKPEAAQNRIVEYTKAHPSFGVEMFYYLALAFYSRGDNTSALKYLNLIPENKIFSSRIYYLRGQVAEAMSDVESALAQYQKAIEFNPGHAKSRLRATQLLYKRGLLKDSAANIEFLIAHTTAMSPRDLAMAYYFHALLSELGERWQIALADMERAIVLEPENHDYMLELYTLRARVGESKEDVKKIAKMYYLLSEGEKLIQQGKYQDALVPFLQARAVNDNSPLPLVKMGDMFNNLHDVENAKNNYKLAAQRAPNDIQIWSKYIDSLIQSYEWNDASKAMDRFRQLPVSQSAIDKAAADMYQKQGLPAEAQIYYRKAMGRDSIDPSVYIAYAKSLMATKNFKDAPFLFSLALRFDPLNVSIKIDIARCVAETESIDRAISMIQDEISQTKEPRAEYLAALSEFQIQKGSWEEAKFNIARAIEVNPDYAPIWRLRALFYMNQEATDKTALDEALNAYKSYSERNPSDPSGYLERYKIFARKAQFEKAKEELDRIFAIYPKYPSLHYYLGALYALQGNHKVGAEEFQKELENNPNNVQTILAFGKELLELKRAQEALSQFTKGMQLSPKSSEAKQQAGWANLALKNYQAALTLMRSAIDLDRANPLLYKRLGLIYRDMNDMNSACNSFRKYLEMEPDAQDKADFASCF